MGMERRALQTDEEMALRCNPARQGHAHSRLPDPCFACQQDKLTLAFARGLPSLEQERKLSALPPVILGGAMIIVVNFVVDLVYAALDPRIRY